MKQQVKQARRSAVYSRPLHPAACPDQDTRNTSDLCDGSCLESVYSLHMCCCMQW